MDKDCHWARGIISGGYWVVGVFISQIAGGTVKQQSLFQKRIKCDQPKIGVSDDPETFFRIFQTSTNTYFTVARKCHQIVDPKLGVVTIWRHQMVESANRGPNNEDIKPYLFGAPGKV